MLRRRFLAMLAASPLAPMLPKAKVPPVPNDARLAAWNDIAAMYFGGDEQVNFVWGLEDYKGYGVDKSC